MDQYNFAMRGIGSLAKAAGAKKIMIAGASSYLVSMLYIRTLGATHANSKVKESHDFLYKIYRELRRHEDPRLKTSTLSEFSDLVGKNWRLTDNETEIFTPDEMSKLQKFGDPSELPTHFELFPSPDSTWGVIIAKGGAPSQERKALAIRRDSHWYLLNWFALYSQNRTTLMIDKLE